MPTPFAPRDARTADGAERVTVFAYAVTAGLVVDEWSGLHVQRVESVVEYGQPRTRVTLADNLGVCGIGTFPRDGVLTLTRKAR